jgi:nitric oxide reductase activation protein
LIGRPVVIDGEHRVDRPTTFSYPEWDVHRRRYRSDWCTVKEVALAQTTRVSRSAPNTHSLRLPLAKVVLDLDRHRRQLQGDDIDLDACVAAQVELASGGVPDESVYVDAVRRRRDLAVLVLLDVSGSAGEAGTAGGSVHESQRETAAALTFAFNDLGDRTALYGFRSIGRSDVQLIPVKRFDERLGAATIGRLGELDPGAYTRLGAAIRHGASQLEDHAGTRRRLLVVLSDGFAYDHGYEGRYGEADARRALFEARRRGIGCLCLSVGAKTDAAALSRVFGTAAHAVVPRPEELAPIARRLFQAALKAAEEQRRTA